MKMEVKFEFWPIQSTRSGLSAPEFAEFCHFSWCFKQILSDFGQTLEIESPNRNTGHVGIFAKSANQPRISAPEIVNLGKFQGVTSIY